MNSMKYKKVVWKILFLIHLTFSISYASEDNFFEAGNKCKLYNNKEFKNLKSYIQKLREEKCEIKKANALGSFNIKCGDHIDGLYFSKKDACLQFERLAGVKESHEFKDIDLIKENTSYFLMDMYYRKCSLDKGSMIVRGFNTNIYYKKFNFCYLENAKATYVVKCGESKSNASLVEIYLDSSKATKSECETILVHMLEK